MRMIVFFDLPVQTKTERRYATTFRNFLLKDGYHMLQFSVYARVCIDHYSNVVVSIHFGSLRLLYDLRPVCQEGVQAIGSCGKLRLAQVGVDFVGGGD